MTNRAIDKVHVAVADSSRQKVNFPPKFLLFNFLPCCVKIIVNFYKTDSS